MTGLEPHPVLVLPTLEQLQAMGPEGLEKFRQGRLALMQAEANDPYRAGHKPPIWHLIDDLLCDGKEVELVGRDYLEIPEEIRRTSSPSLKITGRREIMIPGTNGAAKSEYAARKIMTILCEKPRSLTWCFQRTEEVSQAVQQPLLRKYLPREWQPKASGRLKQGDATNISWSQKGAFTKNSFVLPNRSQNWFKFYKQDEDIVEGPQIHAIWCDEMLYEIDLLRTLRFRLMKHKGLLIVTFTPKSGWTPTFAEYNQGRKVLVELTAKRLPLRDKDGSSTGKFKKMPRVAIAGPGGDGNVQANIVWLNTELDNPYVPPEEIDRVLHGASEKVIMERGYGEATKAFGSQFPKFSERIHVVSANAIPKTGTRYQIVDPVAGRPWFILYGIVDPNPVTLRDGTTRHRRWIYREWPSFGHSGRSAYIPGIGDPGPWALPGNKADGMKGPAQEPNGWGLERYIMEFERLEQAKLRNEQKPDEIKKEDRLPPRKVRNPLQRREALNAPNLSDGHLGESIFERRMDSRYGGTPTMGLTSTTTILDQMLELGVEFVPASGKALTGGESRAGEGVQLINDALDYDDEVPIGEYSANLGRLNYPLLLVSEECPNLIYALREWTNRDGIHGACKDPIDCLHYFFEDDLDYVDERVVGSWQGGGTY